MAKAKAKRKKQGPIEAEADALLEKYGLGTTPGPLCGVVKSGHQALIEAQAARKITSARIAANILIEKKQRVPLTSIQRHRRGACSCGH